jgi:hypothetical protein
MITLTPILTGDVPNPNVGYNNAWIPVANEGNRPFFAKAVYDVTTESTLGQSGFIFLAGNESAWGQFTTIQVLSTCKISALSANNTSIGSLTDYELPVGFMINGPITGITLSYGAAFVYRL